MEFSQKFNFNLPSIYSDDIADINKISENFKMIDEEVLTKDEINQKISQSILKEGNKANNNFANALKVLKSGENVVSATDVSPLEHSLDVKVESKTETVTRTVIEPYGENLLT